MLTALIVALALGTPGSPTGSSLDEDLSCVPLTSAPAQHLLCRPSRPEASWFLPRFVDPASAQACLAEWDVLSQRVAMAGRGGTLTFGSPTTSTPAAASAPAPAAKSTFGPNSVVTLGVLACTQRPC